MCQDSSALCTSQTRVAWDSGSQHTCTSLTFHTGVNLFSSWDEVYSVRGTCGSVPSGGSSWALIIGQKGEGDCVGVLLFMEYTYFCRAGSSCPPVPHRHHISNSTALHSREPLCHSLHHHSGTHCPALPRGSRELIQVLRFCSKPQDLTKHLTGYCFSSLYPLSTARNTLSSHSDCLKARCLSW